LRISLDPIGNHGAHPRGLATKSAITASSPQERSLYLAADIFSRPFT
jgi:hypothetical protein